MNDANCGHADSCACLRPGDAACNCFLAYGFESQEAMDEHDAAIALMRGQSEKK